MAATNAFINWSLVTILPNGGSLITLDRVMSVEFMFGNTQLPIFGDAKRFAAQIATVAETRGCKITSLDAQKIIAVIGTTPCTIVAVLNDALNGNTASGGGVTYTLVNAVRKSAGIGAPNNQLSSHTIEFDSFATADADPFTFALL